MRVSDCRLAVIVVLCLSCLSWLVGGAQAAGLSKQQFAQQRRFAYNNSLFVLYHEMAHLLFDQFDLPVLGREEDAADNLATWTLLNQGTVSANQVLADAARGWFLSSKAYDNGGAEEDYAAPHVLDKQRAYEIVCLMVGKDASLFGAVADKYHLPGDRRESCHFDYGTVDRGLKSLLGRRNNRSDHGSAVTVRYEPAAGSLRLAADAFKSSGVLDQVADELRRNYRLARPVQLRAMSCGEANAYYYPDADEIFFCYELMADYMTIYAANMPAPPRGTGQNNTGWTAATKVKNRP
ncbi:MAG: DUF4344 domain-containing metallopeptidase [Devosia sp.]